MEQIKQQEKGFDVIIEMLANRNLQNDVDLLNKNGTVVVDIYAFYVYLYYKFDVSYNMIIALATNC